MIHDILLIMSIFVRRLSFSVATLDRSNPRVLQSMRGCFSLRDPTVDTRNPA